ncbi:MAG: hypothetical protein ABSB18_03770 [Candidatus Omnitrophota bacterium]
MKLDDFLCVHGAKEFEKLIDKAIDFIGSESIIVEPGDMKDITTKSWQLIHRANKGCPRIFRFGNTLAVLEPESNSTGYHITMFDNYKLRHKLTRLGNWLYYKGKCLYPYVHTITVLEDILAVLDQGVPYLKGIAPVPVFAPDGTLVTEPGYCEKTGFFYCPPKSFVLPKINCNPTTAELEVAKKWILDELLGDFPFIGRAEICHIVALLILSFVRNMIDGPTPLHLIEKSTAGTGATLLARAISYICIGGEFTVLAEGKDSEEMRKRITSVLITAPWFLVLDNLNRVLDSSALATILTATYWEDRILGQSTHLRIPVWCAWVATGNNPTLSYEITRRTIRIRLDAKTETPHLRDASQFKHYPLLPWVMENRAALVGAVLTLIQYWVAKGKPESKKSLGGFESWAAVIGGVLECAGIEGFLENALDFYDDVQTEQEQKKVFVAAWYTMYKEIDVKAGDLLNITGVYDAIFGSGESSTDRSTKTRLGFFIKKLKDQVFQLEFEKERVTVMVRKSKRKIENASAWKLEVVQRKVLFKKQGG